MSKARSLAEEVNLVYHSVEGEPTVSEDLLYVIARTLTTLLEEAEAHSRLLREIAQNTD